MARKTTPTKAAKAAKSAKTTVVSRKPTRLSLQSSTAPAKAATRGKAKRSAASVVQGSFRETRPSAKSPTVATLKRTKSPKPGSAAKAPAAKVEMGALEVQLKKLEKALAALKAKNNEAVNLAKAATARVSDLEKQLATVEQKLVDILAERGMSAGPANATSTHADVDPGDAVPPSVAVREPGEMDDEAATALERLEDHLRPE